MMTTNTDTGDTSITSTSATTSGSGSTTAAITTKTMHPESSLSNGIAGNQDIQAATATTTTVVATAPREALITTAVNFLQNAKVRHSTLMQKQQFLQSKGLTMDEIHLACERAGIYSGTGGVGGDAAVINMGISSHSQLALQPRQSAFGRIREVLHSIALLSGLAYAVYVFWKKFVVPFLFGKKKKKSIDQSLQDIEQKVETRVSEVKTEITQIKETLTQQQREQKQQFEREFGNFRSDLDAIKGLLLNRKNFASPLAAGPPSIPAWQLSTATPHHHRHQLHSQSDDNEKADDAGSGSGSSETEVVTKNSDSSLEIM